MNKADLAIKCPKCEAAPGKPCMVAGTITRAQRTHKWRLRSVGHPITTGSASTPPVFYRVSADQHAELKAEGRMSTPRRTVNQVAKDRVFPPGQTKP